MNIKDEHTSRLWTFIVKGEIMSKADKMFEKLGYKKYETKDIIQYIFDGADTIIFEKPLKYIKLYVWNDGARELAKSINMQELQAINKKCEELGWLERN